MESYFAIAFGVLVALATYLLLSRNVLRMVLGILLLGNAVNLSIFTSGRFASSLPPIILEGDNSIAGAANPLPQALILTAIVISFALTAFAIVLFERTYRSLRTLDTDAMRVVEPAFPSSRDKESS